MFTVLKDYFQNVTAILLDCQKLQSKVILIKNVLDPLY